MSAKAVGWVFDHSPYTGGSLVLHLALADVANDTHGNELWMAVPTMARKCRLSDRQVQRVLHQMVEDGFLQVVRRDRAEPVVYRFVQGGDIMSPVTSDASGGDIRRAGGVTPMSPNTKEGRTQKNASGASQMRGVQPPRYVVDRTPGEPMPAELKNRRRQATT